MRDSELRIGFYYKNNGSDSKLTSKELRDILDFGGEYNYEPIPLTEEWLFKLGFVKVMGHYEKGFPLWVRVGGLTGPTDIWIHGTYCPSVKIAYVHQLQTLYYSLTGWELL